MNQDDPAFLTADELRRRQLSTMAYHDRLDRKMREIAEGSLMAKIVYDHADSLAHMLGGLVMSYDQDKAYELHRYLKTLVCGIAKRDTPDFLPEDDE